MSVTISDCGGNYETSLQNHLDTLADQRLFCSLILLRSYSMMESHAKLITFIASSQRWDLIGAKLSDQDQDAVDAIELRSGIESWGENLINQTGQAWADVYKGKAGLVEVSLIRNAVMHGYTYASGHLVAKAASRGCVLPFAAGQKIDLDFALVHDYRGRLKSFCRILGDGVVHLARGTHRMATP